MSLALAACRTGAALAQALPKRAAEAAFELTGAALALAPDERRFVVERMLRRVLGPGVSPRRLRTLTVAAYASYGRYWAESFRLPGLSDAELDDGLDYEGYEHILAARRAGRGVIVAAPHLGAWERAAFWLTRIAGVPVTAVVEPLQPPELFDWFCSYRRRLGMEIVPLGPEAGGALLRALRDNRVVCLLCDRDLTGDGVEVEFFGERTSVPAGPATLALRTGAAVLPTAVYFEGPRCCARVGAPLPIVRSDRRLRADVVDASQAVTAALEGLIRRAPHQWHVMQPIWPSDRAALEERRKQRAQGRRARRQHGERS
ncbi:MAG: phosphatidylinositol mannoside acyltransferase [Acidimicrobiales bacterium]